MRFNKFTQTAIDAAVAGGKVLQSYYNKNIAVDFKSEIDPVTDADRASQEAIFKRIKKSFPGHAVLGEEGKQQDESSEYRWIVDPLDGTVNFIHNLPLFSVSVALMHNGEVVAGVVHAPLMRETFVAQKGAGAYCNGKRIAVSDKSTLLKSLVVTGFAYTVHSKPGTVMERFARVVGKAQGVRRFGSAAIDLSYVAAGRFEAFWEEGLGAWDVAAGALIVQEAGGLVTDFDNKGNYIFGGAILASNGRIHRSMLRLVKEKGK
jgi:myo-inositol-1(or 4)-monophosphatase